MPAKKKIDDQTATPAEKNDDVEKLEIEIAELKVGWQRTQADFENFRRRSAQESNERTSIQVANALMAIAPVAENLRRALADAESKPESTPEQMKAWLSGISQIARQLDQALSAAGLTSINPTPGEPFNPHEHEALTHQPHENHSVDSVTQVVERGYKVGQRVVQPAKVVVSAGPATDSEK